MTNQMSGLVAAMSSFTATLRRVNSSLTSFGTALQNTSADRSYGPGPRRNADLTIMRVKRGGNAVFAHTRAP